MPQMAFAQLESEITGYSTFLPEAVSGISTAVRGKESIQRLAGRLQNKTGDSVAEAWQESLENARIAEFIPGGNSDTCCWGCFGFRRQREPARCISPLCRTS